METTQLPIGPPTVPETTKALGAFYTDSAIADFLVAWAVRSRRDTVLDPCLGAGVFLRSACERIADLGGEPGEQVRGVEVAPDAHGETARGVRRDFGVPEQHLLLSDFFSVQPSAVGPIDAVVGNPPFVRYQRFTGEARKRALRRAADQGVALSRLSSSWAPFVVHSTAMLREGGRLAMVLPMELGHAAYASPVLAHLRATFAQVMFVTFRRKLFPDLNEDTLLLLAENRGGGPAVMSLRDLPGPDALPRAIAQGEDGVVALDAGAVAEGTAKLIEYLVPAPARDLYRELRQHGAVFRLKRFADVGIGYVTGANAFFHLTPEEVRLWQIPDGFLRPAVLRGRSLTGLRLTGADWRKQSGGGSYLLRIPPEANLPGPVEAYIAHGESEGIHHAYKCRTRQPWYSVPHVYQPEGFLSYMGGAAHHLVANDFGAVAPNSLHILRARADAPATTTAVAALWQTSLTRLSREIEGHALGGGMLKLEPTEAERTVVACPQPADETELRHLAGELDALVREGRVAEAETLASERVLRAGMGLTERDCTLLQNAADALRDRRRGRNSRP